MYFWESFELRMESALVGLFICLIRKLLARRFEVDYNSDHNLSLSICWCYSIHRCHFHILKCCDTTTDW